MTESATGLDRDAILAKLEAATADRGAARKFAREHRLSESYLSDVRNRRRPPGQKIIKALGLILVEAPGAG